MGVSWTLGLSTEFILLAVGTAQLVLFPCYQERPGVQCVNMCKMCVCTNRKIMLAWLEVIRISFVDYACVYPGQLVNSTLHSAAVM